MPDPESGNVLARALGVVTAAAAFGGAVAVGMESRPMPIAASMAFPALAALGAGAVVRALVRPPRPHPFLQGSGAIAVAMVLAALLGLAGWDAAHPLFYVDNAGVEPVQIWVDGAPAGVVPPLKGTDRPAKLRATGKGRHSFGRSRPGEAAPQAIVEGELRNYNSLYNPGAIGCYWVDVIRYGDRESPILRPPDYMAGPVGIQEFYRFSEFVDHWFEPAPDKITARSSERMYRTVVSRDSRCTDLARRGCALSDRQSYQRCASKADRDEQLDACWKAAQASCGLGEGALAPR